MQTHRIQFTSQRALVGIILFYTVGTAMFAWHRERIVTPTSAGSSPAELPDAALSEMTNLPEPMAADHWYNDAAGIGLLLSDESHPSSAVRQNCRTPCGGCLAAKTGRDGNESDLNLFDDVFCTPASPRLRLSGASPQSSTNSLENPQSYAHNFDMLDSMAVRQNCRTAGNIEEDELMLHLKEGQKTIPGFGTEQFSDSGDANETSLGRNIEETNDTVVTSAPAMQVLTKIRTQAKCVEAILKKAVIEPYHINGRIEGLRITGLDKILVARDLLLKSGDIIRAVNGYPLNSKRQAFEIFKRARTRPIIKIELLRDGKSQTLLYYLM